VKDTSPPHYTQNNVGKLGARQAGAINHALETLLKFYLDSKKLRDVCDYDARPPPLDTFSGRL
jgi:hypothetical protein